MAGRPRIPKESPVFDNQGRWTRTWIMYFESLFDTAVAEAVRLSAAQQGEGGLSTSVFPYRADLTSTGASDPGKGKVRWNNATQASATFLYFDWLTSGGFDVTGLMALLDAPDVIILQDTDLALNHQTWELTGPVVMNPDWFAVPVSFVSSSGSGVFTNNQQISVLIP